MSRRRHRWIALVGFLVLLALHLDFWRGERDAILLGWIPEELAYRLVWMALSLVYLWYFCAVLWRGDEERG